MSADDEPDAEADVVRKFHRLYYDRASRTWQNTSWLGRPVYKTPFDLWIYQELIHSLAPDLIVECGTAAGGSSLFLASICDLVDHGEVLTIDIEDRPGRHGHPRIHYVTGSSTAATTIDLVKTYARDANTVLVILDSDHGCAHVLEEMHLYGDVVTKDSYMVVEDGNINGNPVLPAFGPGPTEAIAQFLSDRDDFAIDESREKFFMTFNPRGYLKKL